MDMTPWSFVLALAVTVLAAAPVITLLKGKEGVFLLALLLGLPPWWFGAIRRAKPSSVWARAFYGPAAMGQARARFPGVPLGEPLTPGMMARELRAGLYCLLAVSALMLCSGALGGVFAAAALLMVLLTWRGWRGGRLLAVAVSALYAGTCVYATVTGIWTGSVTNGGFGFLGEAVLTVLAVGATVAGTVLVHLPTTGEYFRSGQPAPSFQGYPAP